jgi:transposase-like protein
VQESARNLTANQEKFLAWLALPAAQRNPKTETEFAAELGVNPSTLWRWKKDHNLAARAAELARDMLKDDLPEIYAALKREAKGGTYQHIKLALEVSEHYVEKKQVGGDPDSPVRIQLNWE